MAKSPTTKNQNDRKVSQIYNQILSIIHSRGIVRSEKLSALSVAEKLGVSRTPVSFAFYRLELENVIAGEVKGGWVVNPPTIDDLEEILAVKEIIFPNIVYKATSAITPDNNAKLFIFLDEIDRSLKWNDLNSWRAADKGFNHLLAISAGNSRLSNFEQILDNQLYRAWNTYLSLPSSDRNIFNIYKDIASAISSGNAPYAEEKAKHFVSEARSNLLKVMREVIIPLLGHDYSN